MFSSFSNMQCVLIGLGWCFNSPKLVLWLSVLRLFSSSFSQILKKHNFIEFWLILGGQEIRERKESWVHDGRTSVVRDSHRWSMINLTFYSSFSFLGYKITRRVFLPGYSAGCPSLAKIANNLVLAFPAPFDKIVIHLVLQGSMFEPSLAIL